MEKKDAIKIFEDKKVRALWDGNKKNGIYQLLMSLEC